jgi:hypothetical protein
MAHPKLEEVFKLSGVPTFTFVKPLEYNKLLVALRTPGRGVIVEGPSGIGKSTAIFHVLDELSLAKSVLVLSARKAEDRDLIGNLPTMGQAGTVIIDDFHRLEDSVKDDLADYLKWLADEEDRDTKLIVVGINRVGEPLITHSRDLVTRIETIRFEVNPDDKVKELIAQGEKALNITINTTYDITKASNGSFFMAQMLCHESCLSASVLEAHEERRIIEQSFESVRYRVMESLSGKFMEIALRFASGKKLRREGRAPHLHVLKWLAEKNEWSIALGRELLLHPELRGSVGQVVELGYLGDLLSSLPESSSVLHYEPKTHVLSVEDPQFVFFLRNLNWNEFAQKVGYYDIHFKSVYDFALSFAGADRPVAERLFELLTEDEFSVFYDRNERYRILAENVEEYLAPIYRSEADFVIALLGPDYPQRIWAKFESEQFKNRFKSGSVVPVWFRNCPPGMFDESTKVGGYTFDPDGDVQAQLTELADALKRKIAEKRQRLPI